MQKSGSVQKLTAASLLIAIGIVIPLFMPIKFVWEPASFTLASHVAVFLSMFISPGTAVAVAAGTTIGFFLGPFPPVVVLRAASHLIFAFAGSLYLQKHTGLLASPVKTQLFSFTIGILHAICELAVVTAFYVMGGMGAAYYSKGFLISVILMVGVGTIIHSMVDFGLALIVLKVLQKQNSFKNLFVNGSMQSKNTPVNT